jgi:hypothetical protein
MDQQDGVRSVEAEELGQVVCTEASSSARLTRRSLMRLGSAAAAGAGLAAAASVLRARPAAAAAGGDLVLGASNSAGSSQTSLTADLDDESTLNVINTNGSLPSAIYGLAGGASGIGGLGAIIGDSNRTAGVVGLSSAGTGVYGVSGALSHLDYRAGVQGQSDYQIGVLGTSSFNSGVYGIAGGLSHLSAPSAGVFGDSNAAAGVVGASAQSTGVYGVSGNGAGVVGQGGGGGDGVSGTAGTGNGVHGLASSATGTGVLAANSAAGGKALQVDGNASFSRSGTATVGGGKKSAVVSGVVLTSASLVLATLQGSQAGLYIEGVLTNVTGKSFAISLSKAAVASIKVAYFILN